MKTLTTVLLSTLVLCSSSLFAADHKVDIKGMAFSPAALSIAVGDTVTFTNKDAVPHTGTAKNKSFDTGFLNQNQSKTVTIDTAGAFDFFCMVHPSMTGKITAKAAEKAAAPAPKEDTSSSAY